MLGEQMIDGDTAPIEGETIVVTYKGSNPNKTFKNATFSIANGFLIIVTKAKKTYINVDSILEFTVE